MYPTVDLKKPYANDDAVLALAVELALHSAELKGGPFGAVITDAARKIVSVGVNAVVASQDSTSHAEINAIRQAHKVTGTYNLKEHRLYTSCAPCILCFGAIYWSGIQEVMAAAHVAQAQQQMGATHVHRDPAHDKCRYRLQVH